jgi:ribosome-associated protein
MSENLPIRPGLVLEAGELRLSFSRSSGPGGQNVNKLNTRVELRFNVAASPSLTETQKKTILARLASRVTSDADIVLFSEKTRYRGRNIEDARQRLRDLLATALEQRKRRIPTRIPASVKKNRIKDKRRHGEKKQLRRPPSGEE